MALKKQKDKQPRAKKNKEPQNDIEKARVKKRVLTRRERQKKWLIALGIVLGLFLIRDFFNVFDIPHYIRVGFNSITHHKSYPLETNMGINKQIENIGSQSFVVTDTSFYIVNGSGYYVQEGIHNINQPIAKTNGKQFLIYGKSEKSVVTGGMYKNRTFRYEQNILYGAVAQNGYYALVFESERYFNEVAVYNNKGKEIYRWLAANEYIANINFTANGKGLIINCVKSDKGDLDTMIYTINFNSEKAVSQTHLEDFLAVDYFEKSGNIIVIGDTKTVRLNKKGEIMGTYEYGGQKLIACDTSSSQITLVLATAVNSYYHDIKILDTSLVEQSSFGYQNNVKHIAKKGNKIFLLNDRLLTQVNLKGEVKKETNLQNNGTGLISRGGSTIVMSKAVLEKISNG